MYSQLLRNESIKEISDSEEAKNSNASLSESDKG